MLESDGEVGSKLESRTRQSQQGIAIHMKLTPEVAGSLVSHAYSPQPMDIHTYIHLRLP
ncbi:conserved hypothetical protein [Ricinus communis]|uniref:Uncharacterized protein n=1 Tax=Ricinus communis TaxID=3988 RepID=B9RA31_RICCO|nr:conserved hypothetical protein [Ricinus communis]